jgi:transcriptional regulator with XRE-family HTH domain
MTYTRGEMKAARQLTGLSQRELGRLAGYSPSRIAASKRRSFLHRSPRRSTKL